MVDYEKKMNTTTTLLLRPVVMKIVGAVDRMWMNLGKLKVAIMTMMP